MNENKVENEINKVELFNKKLSKVIEAINATEIGKIEIDGRKYTTVATRTEFFRREFGFEAQIITDLINVDEDSVIAKAEIGFFKDDKWFCIATGHAEEKRNTSKLNEVSALEIAETSAIGRALSNLGLSGGEYASANEVLNAKEDINAKEEKSKEEKTEEVKKITNAQKEIIKNLIKETNSKALTFFKKYKVKNIDDFNEKDAFEAIQELKEKKQLRDDKEQDDKEQDDKEMKIL